MFDRLQEPASDKIIALMAEYRADPRAQKLDLGVGVYRDESGATPIMGAVRAAGARLQDSETTKAYTGLAGDPAFLQAISRLVLGDSVPLDRTAAAAAPGGTGALHQAFALIRSAAPDCTLWLPDPTWPNHLSLIAHQGLTHATYRYFDAATGAVDMAGLMEDLQQAAPGDVVLLHGCCHNPTGADPMPSEWDEIAAMLRARQLIPLVDLAYQGFGDGIEADASAVRMLASTLDEVLIAASGSKSFGLYRDRVGALLAVARDPAEAERTGKVLTALNRVTYSFPPDHGARLVQTVLDDPALRADWEEELGRMRLRILALREALAAELRRLTNSDRFDFLLRHRGMFSRLPAEPAQVARLREEHGIYMTGDGRINIAGLGEAAVPLLARAIVETGL